MLSNTPISRRRFLRDAGLATAATTLWLPQAAQASGRRISRAGRSVAVFGGGVAGLTAAHELAERGFDVTLYERRAWGGKARSTDVAGSASGGRRPLPGEHGFRIEFGFYENLPDTLKRIPFGSNQHGVFDNMVEAPQVLFARDRGRQDLSVPTGSRDVSSYEPARVVELIRGLLLETNLPPGAAAYFVDRLVVYLSSCDQRRRDDWERMSWEEFIHADRFSEDYRQIFGNIPRWLQALKPGRISADEVARVAESFVYNILGAGSNGPLFRTLDAPTNEAWIDPWLAHLQSMRVRLRLGAELQRLEIDSGQISGARIRDARGTKKSVVADWYVVALPSERARRLWTAPIIAADPHLRRMRRIEHGWMNGMKFFLREQRPIVRGVITHLDSEWAVTGISQAQFWKRDFAATYGDGRVRDCISVAISDWNTPGPLYGKTARQCTPDEVATEVWEQIKRHVNNEGEAPVLTDDVVLSWDIDPGMKLRHGHLVSQDPLPVATVGSRADRPNPETAIPNLMLAGDYLQSDWWVGCMESACETGRRAANAILDRSESNETPATVFPHYRPPEWEPLKRLDEQRYVRRQPNAFDTPTPTRDALALLGRG